MESHDGKSLDVKCPVAEDQDVECSPPPEEQAITQRSLISKNKKKASSGSANSSYLSISSSLFSSPSVKVESPSTPHQDHRQNPWPHLEDYFVYVSRDGDRFVFNCKMCLPKNVLISGHKTSLNNLKQHINRTHPNYSIPFLETVRDGSCRGKRKKRVSLDSSGGDSFPSKAKKKPSSLNNASRYTGIKTKKRVIVDSHSTQVKPKEVIFQDSSSGGGNNTSLLTKAVPPEVPIENLPQQDQAENPWPRLADYFVLNSKDGDKYIFNCKICMPKNALIKAHKTTLSNLKLHIRRTHPADFKEFLGRIKRGRKNKPKKKLYSDSSSEGSTLDSLSHVKKPRQHTKPFSSDVSQSLVEQRIVDFFVSNLLPHSAVESESFERLVRTLNPTKHSISRRTLGRRISNRQHDGLKEHLIRVLAEVRWVGVSVDCCFAHKKGYLGMTVHWLDPASRKTQSAVLACSHLTATQSYSEVCQAMVKVQQEFGIEGKVTRVTMGESFLRAQYTPEAHPPPQVVSEAQSRVGHGVDAAVSALLSGCIDDQQMHYITLSNPLVDNGIDINHLNLPTHMTNSNQSHITYASQNPDQNQMSYANPNTNQNHLTYSNPHSNQSQLICINPNPSRIATSDQNQMQMMSNPHHTHTTPTTHTTTTTHTSPPHSHSNPITCTAYTLNLVGGEDAEGALQFNGAYINALAKARALWNQQDSSLVVADSILAEVGLRLVVPDNGRWTSTYEAVVVLNSVLESKRPPLHRVMAHMKLNAFDDQDVYFLKEYAMVMSPLAKALEKVQREDQAYLGALLPTVAATIFRLNDLKTQGLVYCTSLVDALLIGIYKRFGCLLEDQECQLAAAFHPRFRLIWLEKFNNLKVASVRKCMEERVEEVMRQQGRMMGGNEEEDDFFSAVTHPQENSNAQHLVKTWLETNTNDLLTDAAFIGEQVLVDLFIRFNTAVPSSAAVDRLFSKGTDLFQKKSSLSEDKFDMLIFMKGNMHFMEKIENGKKAKKTLNY